MKKIGLIMLLLGFFLISFPVIAVDLGFANSFSQEIAEITTIKSEGEVAVSGIDCEIIAITGFPPSNISSDPAILVGYQGIQFYEEKTIVTFTYGRINITYPNKGKAGADSFCNTIQPLLYTFGGNNIEIICNEADDPNDYLHKPLKRRVQHPAFRGIT